MLQHIMNHVVLEATEKSSFDIKGINYFLKYSKIEMSYDNLAEYFTMFLLYLWYNLINTAL